jgi:hypothetical protein
MEVFKMSVKLQTYYLSDHDVIFEVSKEWLQSKLDKPVNVFLSEYTFDDSEPIYNAALEENEIISSKVIDAEV